MGPVESSITQDIFVKSKKRIFSRYKKKNPAFRSPESEEQAEPSQFFF